MLGISEQPEEGHKCIYYAASRRPFSLWSQDGEDASI